jgi:dihydrofolate synthase/folylpolyglutamate synthase
MPGEADFTGQSFSLRHAKDDITIRLRLPLLGQHQLANAATAVATISALRQRGVQVQELALHDGLQAVRWPGRLEILSREPLVVADGAHNGDSARKLMAALQALGGSGRLILILGGSADHLTPDLLGALVPAADRAIATQSQHPRAAEPAWIQARAAELGFHLEDGGTVDQALELALADAGPDDLICCTGSLFVAGEARAVWFSRQGLPLPPSDPV